MLILYAIIFACVTGGAALWYHSIGASAVAKHEQEVKVAQDKQDAIDKAKSDVAEHAAGEIRAAWEAGHAKARIVYRDNETKGANYAASGAITSNPECVIPRAGVSILASARAGIPITSDTSATAVPRTGGTTGSGNDAAGSVPANAAGRGAVGGVPGATQNNGGANSVPATGAGRAHPKPIPK